MNADVERDGFAIIPGVIGEEERGELIALLGDVSGAGRRGLLALPGVAALARSSRLSGLVQSCFAFEGIEASKPVPVRAIYFDKSPSPNWLVPWHQDLTLALRERVEMPGFGPWSVKEGILDVQPPVELMGRMLAVRLHLDDTDGSNGALRVLPGSHRMGRLSGKRIQELRAGQEECVCVASAGDALLMRPLLLHASGRSTSGRHRRVLHIEYAAFALPAGLEWCEAA